MTANDVPRLQFLPALHGVRVVDFTQIAAGPYCSSLLGDLGADVVSVEPVGGEPFRLIDNIFGPGESAYYFGINRNKRSLTLDVRTPAARDVVDRLVRSADVVMVGFRAEAVVKLGLDYERLRDVNPRIVYCGITAFGETGPRAGDPGMDIIAQAISGVMGLTGEPGRSPVKVGPPIADFVVSYLAGFAICAALYARERDGEGQKVTLNLLDGQIASLANYITPYLRTREPIRPMAGGHPQLVPYQVFKTADDWMIVACLNDRFWPPLCNAIDRPDLADMPEYRTNVDRVRNRDRLLPELEALFARAPRAEWIARLKQHGVPASEVHALEDALEDAQVVHNDAVVELTHPRHGPYAIANNPMRFDLTPARMTRHVASLGEHTDEVLAELGLSPDEISHLRSAGVV